MTELKFIKIKMYESNPTNATYNFSICNQSHTNGEFGDDGSNSWSHNGFVLKSVSHPETTYLKNRLFVRGDYQINNEIELRILPPDLPSISTLNSINNWFNLMMETIEAYNLYYSKIKRINIFHK